MTPEQRLKILLGAPADSWVAFSEDETEVVAFGSSYEEAVQKAENKGITEPVLVRTPKDWRECVLS